MFLETPKLNKGVDRPEPYIGQLEMGREKICTDESKDDMGKVRVLDSSRTVHLTARSNQQVGIKTVRKQGMRVCVSLCVCVQ